MRFLYLSAGDVFSRHELGFVAALRALGRADVVVLGGAVEARRWKIGSDNGIWDTEFYCLPRCDPLRISTCVRLVKMLMEAVGGDYDAVFATPRLPILVARALPAPLRVLRLWSIRAAKLRDNLRFGAYGDVLLYVPSVAANLVYIAESHYAIAVDHATYMFARRTYLPLRGRIAKLYPPYGYIAERGEDVAMPEAVERGGYILGFTSLHKTGAYLTFEAKPHALVLYQLAKRVNLDVVLAGSTYEDWRRVFPSLSPPKNLHIIGRGFDDYTLAKLYRKARLVVVPITNRNISNRLLEALFYGKAIVTSEVVKFIHPELLHNVHAIYTGWDTIVDDVAKIVKDDEQIERLEKGAKVVYRTMFSTSQNIKFIKKILLK
jgi:glycosyltransferase involved in cell wall biosynthesis